MICPFCKKEIPDHTQFCPECGQRVDQDNGNKGESASYWSEVEKEAERDNKIRAEAEKKIQQKKQQTKHTVIGLLICAVAIVIFICYMTIIKPAQQYSSASNLFDEGQYQAALQVYDSLGSYKDSASKADLCRENIKEQDYQAAITLFKSNNYSEALPLFRELNNYKDCSVYIKKCETALDESIPSSDTVGITEEEIEETNPEVQNDFNDSPFSQKYWVIFTEGYRDDRVEASTIDSSLPAEQLSIIWDSSLVLNDTSGSEGCDQYYLDENGEWVYMGNYYRLTDYATNVLASNLDIVNENGDVYIAGIPYSEIDWSKIERYR